MLFRSQTKANKAETNAKSYANSIKPTKVSELENDKNYVTQEELGDAGYGDMQKSVYDTDSDGVVDKAKTVVGPVTCDQLRGVV